MAKSSKNIFDYLDWRGDISFSELGVCEVDSLIFSLISYIDFEGIVPSPEAGGEVRFIDAAKQFVRRYRDNGKTPIGLIIPKETVLLLAKAAKTRRFGQVWLTRYVNHICDGEQKQFSAITFVWKNRENSETAFVSFRGTDDTIVGWKENFNMSFMQPVPSQLEAAAYLEAVSRSFFGKLYVGGHSKGGNLAVFASVKCAPHIKARIINTYNMDGPGFDEDFISGADYAEMRDRIRTIVPQSSVVGMLLEHEENYEVVKSDGVGLLQHNGFSWEVMGGGFIHLDSVTGESRIIDETLKQWIAEMSPEERKAAIDSIYDSITNTNAKTLSDLNADKRKLVKAWSAMNNESRTFVKRCIGLIFKNTK